MLYSSTQAPRNFSCLKRMPTDILENPKDFWKAVLGEVEIHLSSMVFNSFVSRTTVETIEDNKVIVLCDDNFVKQNLEKRYNKEIEAAVKKISKKDLEVVTAVRKNSAEDTPKAKSADLGPLFQPKDQKEVMKEKQGRSNLNPKFTFDNYIMGKNNNLAFAVATAVAQRPGEQYNPVFIYSKVGLGKTHLMQAIGNEILRTKPGTKVIYTTGESFANELIEAIQSGRNKGKYTTNDFRNKYRKADVFLIDDVQFIIGKESTQEEFFHTFNDLHMNQKQIVITSDRPPREYSNLAERITSRFSSGIVVDIQTPDMEVRAAILRNKRDESADPVSNDIINYIAENVNSNIRELVGAYMQVVTEARNSGSDANIETAAKALGQTLKEKSQKNMDIHQILKAVCTYYAVKIPDIKGKSREKEFVVPRQVAMYLMKELTQASLVAIGDFLGGRDHTTVMHGTDKIKTESMNMTKIGRDVINVRQSLGV